MVLDSTFDTQPTVSPSGVCALTAVNSYSAVSGAQSISTTAARRARLPAAAPIVRKRLPPDTTRLVVKKPLDRVEDRILVRGGLGGGRGSPGGRGADVLPHAVVLLPALERIVEVDRLPLRVAVLEQPAHLLRHRLREPPDVVAILPAKIERDQHRLDRHAVDRGPLPLVDVGGNLGARIELGDALVRDRDQLEAVLLGDVFLEQLHREAGHVEHRVDAPGLELGQRLAGIDRHHLGGHDLGELEEQTRGEIGAAPVTADGHALAGQVVEIADALLAQQVDFLVVEREYHPRLLGDAAEDRVRLHPRHECEHVGLHDAHLHARALVDREDVLDGALRRVHGEVHVRLRQLLQIEAELIVGALVAAGDDAHVLRGRTEARGDQQHQDCHRAHDDKFRSRHRCSPISGSCPAAHKWASPVPAAEIELNPPVGANKAILAWRELPQPWILRYPTCPPTTSSVCPRRAVRGRHRGAANMTYARGPVNRASATRQPAGRGRLLAGAATIGVHFRSRREHVPERPLPTDQEVRALIHDRRNWGRWGKDDQLGAINLITPAKRATAARLVRTGRRVSLSRPFPKEPGPNNALPAQHYMRTLPRGKGASPPTTTAFSITASPPLTSTRSAIPGTRRRCGTGAIRRRRSRSTERPSAPSSTGPRASSREESSSTCRATAGCRR